jgi:hypothetical protein
VESVSLFIRSSKLILGKDFTKTRRFIINGRCLTYRTMKMKRESEMFSIFEESQKLPLAAISTHGDYVI